MSRGYRCIVPGCVRRVAYGYVPRLFCEPCWVAIDTEITSALVAAFQDVRRKRPGSLDRYAEAKNACHDAAAAAGVIPQHPQTGDGTAASQPPVGSPRGRPAVPPAAVPSPQHPPLPGDTGHWPESPGTASGGPVGVGDVSGVETADGSASVSPPGPGGLPAPTTPTTQAPAPDPVDGGTADGSSPIAAEQDGGVPRPGRCGTPPPTTNHI